MSRSPYRAYMTERQWELYRLSVIERLRESPYKSAVLDGIRHRLRMIEMQEASAAAVHEPSTRKLTQQG
jgi:hypothetical protein